MKVLSSPQDVYSLTHAPVFTKIAIWAKMRNDSHIVSTPSYGGNVTQNSRLLKSDV